MNAPKDTIVYITREIERALGIEPNEGFRIVTNHTPYGKSLVDLYPGFVTLIESEDGGQMGTSDLLRHDDTTKLLTNLSEQGREVSILVFKNTARIEPLVHERGWKLLNPPAALSEKIENKITQIAWLGSLTKYLPTHHLEITKDIAWTGKPFIIQWAHGHTGGGTALISSETELNSLKERFPHRRSRISDYISGPSFTLNVIATADRVLASSPSYQITGLRPFTDITFSTIGNDWGAAHKILSPADQVWLNNLITEVGQKMREDSWRGLFGLDVMKDSASGKMYLIEINARQPASSTFESALQTKRREKEGARGLTTFEAHIAALSGQSTSEPLIEVSSGAQIIQRVTATTKNIPDDAPVALQLAGFDVVNYQNKEPNADLLRIQSEWSIVSEDGKLNATGEKILSIIGQK